MTEGTVSTKSVAVIDIDCSDTLYCFGVIGNGGAFCIKTNCKVRSHASAKMPFAGVDDSFVFIRRNIPGSVFSQPKLASSKITDEVMLDWTSKTRGLADWANEFQAIDGTDDLIGTAEEVQSEAEFLVDSSLLRTPAKRKKESFGSESWYEGDRPSWRNPKYLRFLPSEPEDLLEFSRTGLTKKVVATSVSNIETYIEDMGDALVDVTSVHHGRLMSLEDNLETLLGMVQTMKAAVGSQVDIGERFTAPTL